MKRDWCKYLFLALLVFQATRIFAGVEPVDFVVLDGTDFIPNPNNPSPITTFSHQLTQFNSSTYSFPANQQVRKINNMVQLYLDPNHPQYIGFAYTLEVVVNITKYENGSNAPSTTTATLQINYDPKERTRWIEKANFIFGNCGKVECAIQSVTFLQSTPLTQAQLDAVSKVIGLRIDIEIERYYIFNYSVGLTDNHVYEVPNTVTNELTIHWHSMLGAEYYDLEWAYVDDYGVTNANNLVLGRDFDLNRNATRIQTTEEQYTFPLVYERGYILYRVRGVGMKYDASNDKLYPIQGRWSNPATSSPTGPEQAPTVTTWVHKFHVTSAFEADKMNWQIITSYAEEGKSKSIVTVRDGTDRTRQTITGLSTEKQAMVAEKIFDHQGRPAIEVLPVPTNDPTLKYYQLFNRTSATTPYTRTDFDITSSSCTLIPNPMHTSNGASRYYSPNNPEKTDQNAYIPDADGYPFIQTEFTPDNTGRIRRQSGVGIQHRLGSDHETKYFYGTPAQEEISMLFGIEVGEADHLKKNVVQDPNGQLSVSYLDLKGKVIATALAGNPPANLDTLPSYDSIQMDIDLMVFNQKDSIHNELIATRTFTVTHKSNYLFSYGMSNQPYVVNLCDVRNLCYDCVYDLEIRLIDNDSCNTIKLQEIKGINPVFNTLGQVNVDNTCPKGPTTFSFDYNDNPSFSKILKVGSYTIEKRLRVNQAATEEYVNDYLREFAIDCKSIYEDTLDFFLSKVDSSACDMIDSSKALNRCEVAREGMLLDMSPGGQYGLIDWITNTASDPLSVYNTSNTLPQNHAGYNARWNNPNLIYKEEDGITPSIIINTAGAPVPPNDPSITLAEFLVNWQASWAKELIQFHPEYCYLEWCERDMASFDFDVELAEVNTYNKAVTKGYLSSSSNPSELSLWNLDPYFQTGSGAYLAQPMKDIAQKYYQTPTTDYTMMEIAVWAELLKVPGPAASLTDAQNWLNNPPANAAADTIWQRFRGLYLGKKEQLQYFHRTRYAIDTCSNYGGYNECVDTSYFNFFRNQYAWATPFAIGKFYQDMQACSRPFFHLYRDKAIRFPSVYHMPLDFDPYAPADDIIDDFDAWADSLTTSICDSCQCSNTQFTEFINWLFDKQHHVNHNVLVAMPPFVQPMSWFLSLGRCIGDPVTHFKTSDAGGKLSIQFFNAAGNPVGMLQIITNDPMFNWKLAGKIKCINAAGTSDGMHLGDSELILTDYTSIPVSVLMEPRCIILAPCEKKPSCPPSDLAREFSQLVNSLIVLDTLAQTLSVNFYVGSHLQSYFHNGPTVPRSIMWTGSMTNSTLTVTLGGNANCRFIFDFPSGFSATDLKDLGPIVSFQPDVTQIDPVSGYTYAATIKILVKNSKTPILVKVKSSCFPFSFCLKCPPGQTSPKKQVSNQKKAGKTSQPLKPGLNDPVTEVPISDVHLKPTKETCYPCDPKLFTTTYDSLVGKDSVVMVTTKPSPTACDPCAWPNDTLPWIPFPNPCLEEQVMAAYANAANAYQNFLDSIVADFRNGYIRHCLDAAETFSVKYTDALHHFTLYYYDQANNLVKTIPPEGVHPLNATQTKQAILHMRGQGGTAIVPAHTMRSDYTFNSLNQLIEQTIPDHTGKSEFFYDYLGRIVVSQNPEQRAGRNYSYTKYDALNRPKETGELLNVSVTNPMTHILVKDTTQLRLWLDNWVKREVTKTTYDAQTTVIANLHFNGRRNNYRDRIAAVSYAEMDGSPVVNSTYYLYDIHGNVKELVQDVHQLGAKKLIYQYDLISGSVKEVHYQPGEVDQYIHRYAYDADNRIKYVWTSFDGMVWDMDARYQYYAHGPLARIDLGENAVQGIDFGYTIQGWIKGVNSGALRDKLDMGRDGDFGGQHGTVAEDAFGYMLRYYTDDYKMIGQTQSGINWEPDYLGTPFHRPGRDLFNGNIQSMITALQEPVNTPTPIGPMGYTYTYDQLSRITSMEAFNSLDRQQNLWSGSQAIDDYVCRYTYDANGNLDTLIRNGVSPVTDMDKFKYHYYPGKNQLAYVGDRVDKYNYPDDIDDQPQNSYQYDRIGNLVQDQAENLSMKWNVAGKVKSIDKLAASEQLTFSYDPTSKRVIKSLRNNLTQKTESTYYVLDATGNVMAIYSKTQGPGITKSGVYLSSLFMYGSSRLGEERIDSSLTDLAKVQSKTKSGFYSYRSRGSKYFELGNHLGNVLTTVSDRRLQFDNDGDGGLDEYVADAWTVNDYYPFGSPMPGRIFSNGDYQFGFNGYEKDDEIANEGSHMNFDFRIEDTRLGRFLSVDPLYTQFHSYSPYQLSSNNPILSIDFLGLKSSDDKNPVADQTHIDELDKFEQMIADGMNVDARNISMSNSNSKIDQIHLSQMAINRQNVEIEQPDSHEDVSQELYTNLESSNRQELKPDPPGKRGWWARNNPFNKQNIECRNSKYGFRGPSDKPKKPIKLSFGFRAWNMVIFDVRIGSPSKEKWDINFPGRNNRKTKGFDMFYRIPKSNTKSYYTTWQDNGDGTSTFHLYFGGKRIFLECSDGEKHLQNQ